METKGDFNLLPEDCITLIASLCTPRDACVSSLVSSAFRSAADSDVVWERFLPSDYASFLSRAIHPVQYASKKELYLRLCDLVQIDSGKLSFRLEKSTGAKCFMIPARKMNTKRYMRTSWKLIPISDSRFPEAAKLLCDGDGTLLMLDCRIESKYLAPYTTYASYLIFKLTGADGLKLTELMRNFYNNRMDNVCEDRRGHLTSPVDEIYNESHRKCSVALHTTSPNNYLPELEWKFPKQRTDGWMEVEMEKYYNENWENREVEISLKMNGKFLTNSPIILGLELRPKKVLSFMLYLFLILRK